MCLRKELNLHLMEKVSIADNQSHSSFIYALFTVLCSSIDCCHSIFSEKNAVLFLH